MIGILSILFLHHLHNFETMEGIDYEVSYEDTMIVFFDNYYL
jgi:hypothetical protein